MQISDGSTEQAVLSFGDWLRRRRRALDMTQQELAVRAGCARITIRKIEAGDARPSKQLAELLAEALGISATERGPFIRAARSGATPVQLQSPATSDNSARHETSTLRLDNLPVQLTNFIGREREQAEVKHLLATTHLLTLTGSAGIGKTRLSLQAAADILDAYRDGIWFVDLAPISDPGLVAQVIAQTLRLTEAAGKPILEVLKDFVREKEMLLILDNFEQVLDAGMLVKELLTGAPKLKIVVTSRTSLRITGEREYQVPVLASPDPDQLPPVDQLTQFDAVRLFTERAQVVKSDFTITQENAPAVAEICFRLHGLPLALELAAARVRVLPPQKMLTQLSERMVFLIGGVRDAPLRQKTMRGAIEWSYNLLTVEEQTLFRVMSVFVCGGTLEALEAVCDRGGKADVLSTVEALADKSLLKVSEAYGEPRFMMLDMIREYAHEKASEAGELMRFRTLHLNFFTTLAETALPQLRAADPLTLSRLETELDNIRSALKWVFERGDSEQALRIGNAMAWFWDMRGYWTECRQWLKQILALSRRFQTSRSVSRDYLCLYAKTLGQYGHRSLAQGDISIGRACCEESLALMRELGDKDGIATALVSLGRSAFFQGDQVTARVLFDESLGLRRELGDKSGIAYTLWSLAILAREQGYYEEAKTYAEESLTLQRELGQKSLMGWLLENLGILAILKGDYIKARTHLDESIQIHQELGSKHGLAWAVMGRGLLALYEGDYRSIHIRIQQALPLLQAVGAPSRTMVRFAAVLANAELMNGRPLSALRLLGASGAEMERLGIRLTDIFRDVYERARDTAKIQVGDASFNAGFTEGHNMTLDQAITCALENDAQWPIIHSL